MSPAPRSTPRTRCLWRIAWAFADYYLAAARVRREAVAQSSHGMDLMVELVQQHVLPVEAPQVPASQRQIHPFLVRTTHAGRAHSPDESHLIHPQHGR